MTRRRAIFLQGGRMYCPRKPSGSMPAGQARPRRTRGEIRLVHRDANWNHGNDANQTENVGQYSANPWGFFDMHGNVWEWTADAGTQYSIGSTNRSFNVRHGLAPGLSGRFLDNPARTLRSAYRCTHPQLPLPHIGFRVGFQQVQIR